MKSAITFISDTLSKIISLSLSIGIVPDKMKIAEVVPLFKSGDNQLYTNYRTASILPSFSKIIEKIVYRRLMNYLQKIKILNI